jgi:hypothetical protein
MFASAPHPSSLTSSPTQPRSQKQPSPSRWANATILVETPHQLLVNKLCALLSRSELRDLVDVRVLIESGLDLTRALADCPGQDAGFSPLTFAWSARALPIRRIAAAQGWSDTEIDALEQFRDDLIGRVLAESQPDNRFERAVPFFSNSAVQPCIAVRIRSDRCEIRTDIGQNSIFAAPKPT